MVRFRDTLQEVLIEYGRFDDKTQALRCFHRQMARAEDYGIYAYKYEVTCREVVGENSVRVPEWRLYEWDTEYTQTTACLELVYEPEE